MDAIKCLLKLFLEKLLLKGTLSKHYCAYPVPVFLTALNSLEIISHWTGYLMVQGKPQPIRGFK